MKSEEIEKLMILKKYLLEKEEYLKILNTSPQINKVEYCKKTDNFYMKTDDRYEFYFNVKRKEVKK